ncbi:hypothetical protein ASF94_15710 [Acidovorax sp. Leaf160]|nr:hypothetical protein ASF94_15710 [Acidovorax sp. Leaf160]
MMSSSASSGAAPGPSNTLNIQGSQIAPDLRSMAIASGWDQASKLFVNITAPYINRLVVSQSFPAGIEITIGANTIVSSDGSSAALTASVPVSVRNLGQVLASGGNGGYGGLITVFYQSQAVSGYGGAGGAGAGFAPGSLAYSSTGGGGASGSSQTYTGPTFPGDVPATARGGDGGGGGGHGQAGLSGFPGSASGTYTSSSSSPPGGVGSPSNAVTGNSYITWLATGTRTGAIT